MTDLLLDVVNVGYGRGARQLVLSSPALRVGAGGKHVVTTSDVVVKVEDAPVSVQVVPGALRVQFRHPRGADRVDVVVPDVEQVTLSELVATAEVATQPSAVEALLAALESRMGDGAANDELVAQVAALSARIEGLKVLDPEVLGRVEALEAAVQAIHGVDLAPLEQRVQALENAPAQMVDLQPLEGRLTALEKLKKTLDDERGSVAEVLGSFIAPDSLYQWGAEPGFPSKDLIYEYLALAVKSIAAPEFETTIDIAEWMESTGYFKDVQNAYLSRKGLTCALTIDSCVILAPAPERSPVSLNRKAAQGLSGYGDQPQELLDEVAFLWSCLSPFRYTSPVPTGKAGMMVVSDYEAGGSGVGLRWWGYPTDGVTPVTVQETWPAWNPMPMLQGYPPDSVTPLDEPQFTG